MLAACIHIVSATRPPTKTVTWRYDRQPTPPREGSLPMLYRQITFEERYTVGLLRQQGLSPAAIARTLGRHRSTIGPEGRGNRAPSDGTRPPPPAARSPARGGARPLRVVGPPAPSSPAGVPGAAAPPPAAISSSRTP